MDDLIIGALTVAGGVATAEGARQMLTKPARAIGDALMKKVSGLQVMHGVSEDVALLEQEQDEETKRQIAALHEHLVKPMWDGRPDTQMPTKFDLLATLFQTAKRERFAGDHRKRKMLWNAFFSSFDPRFYHSGQRAHLLEMSASIEYPEARWLAKSVRELADSSGPPRELVDDDGGPAFVHARRLEKIMLVSALRPETRISALRNSSHRHSVVFSHEAEAFIEFIWDEELWENLET